MLTPFPQLLMFEFFAPTILRIAAALIFIYLAYVHFGNRGALSRMRYPIVGSGAWIVWVSIILEVAIAAMLFFGYYTQYAAIAGAIFALKMLIWKGKYPTFFVLPRSTAILLLVILFTLLVTGAGAFAFDLPL